MRSICEVRATVASAGHWLQRFAKVGRLIKDARGGWGLWWVMILRKMLLRLASYTKPVVALSYRNQVIIWGAGALTSRKGGWIGNLLVGSNRWGEVDRIESSGGCLDIY